MICEHCWHGFTSSVVRDGKNLHGPHCETHPDIKKPHEHVILVHKKKCCQCGSSKTAYDEYTDKGSGIYTSEKGKSK